MIILCCVSSPEFSLFFTFNNHQREELFTAYWALHKSRLLCNYWIFPTHDNFSPFASPEHLALSLRVPIRASRFILNLKALFRSLGECCRVSLFQQTAIISLTSTLKRSIDELNDSQYTLIHINCFSALPLPEMKKKLWKMTRHGNLCWANESRTDNVCRRAQTLRCSSWEEKREKREENAESSSEFSREFSQLASKLLLCVTRTRSVREMRVNWRGSFRRAHVESKQSAK